MDPVELVRDAEAAYTEQDMDRKLALFHPEAVIYWNGRKVAEGLAEVRQFHEEGGEADDLEVRKTLRAASEDTIAVEWNATGIDSDGTHFDQYGGEFWTMRDDRLREWHAYDEVYEHDTAAGEYLSHHQDPPTSGDPRTDPEERVREAESAYTAQDVDRIVELFDPEIVIYWDGRKVADGLAEARSFHEELYAQERDEYDVRKSLRAASGDTIAVEWTVDWIDDDGSTVEGYGGEFWTMRDGRLREWHAYYEEYEPPDDGRENVFLSHHSAADGAED